MCCRAKDNTTALARSLRIMNAMACVQSALRKGVELAMAVAAAWAARALVRTCRLGDKARWLARSAPVRVQGGLVGGLSSRARDYYITGYINTDVRDGRPLRIRIRITTVVKTGHVKDGVSCT